MLEKIDYFSRRGDEGGYPFTENFAKIIDLVFEPIPYLTLLYVNPSTKSKLLEAWSLTLVWSEAKLSNLLLGWWTRI